MKKRGFPSKMKPFIKALKNVLDTRKILFLSDEDLMRLVNQEIKKNGDPRCQIEYRTFKHWKAGNFAPDDDTGREFMELLALAYIDQKEQCGIAMFECDSKDKGDWRRYSFVLERRFKDEFGQNSTLEVTNKRENIIQIQAGNAENAQLIDNIINGGGFSQFKVVEPQKLNADNTESEEHDF